MTTQACITHVVYLCDTVPVVFSDLLLCCRPWAQTRHSGPMRRDPLCLHQPVQTPPSD